MFKTYTGYEYLLIDIANQYGLDKLTFEERINWANCNMAQLENSAKPEDKHYPLYLKAVMTLRKAQKGIPTGHMVAMDSVCSGIQLMSVLTGCVAGATATGLVNPNVRADAYTAIRDAMELIIGGSVAISRDLVKEACMTGMYGSKLVPKRVFGEDTPELNAFYGAMVKVAPGAWELLQDLLASWQPYTLSHEWKLPDGFDAKVKVMAKKETRIEIDECNNATFTYQYYENEGSKTGLSNVANMIHSIDALVLREMVRRCNYDREIVEYALESIEIELIKRSLGRNAIDECTSREIEYYREQYQRSTVASAVIIPWLNEASVMCLSTEHLHVLTKMLSNMRQYQPFELITVHDAFSSHANHLNWVRYQYKEILADLADSDLLSDLMSQITGTKGTYQKLSSNLGNSIRLSNYALS